jgi:hypothetical protein
MSSVTFEIEGYTFSFNITDKEYNEALKVLVAIRDLSPSVIRYISGWFATDVAYAKFALGSSSVITLSTSFEAEPPSGGEA